MIKVVIVSALLLTILIINGCYSDSIPRIIKKDADSVTVLYEGHKLRIKPKGLPPEKAKGVKKQGIFIYDDETNGGMKVQQGRTDSVNVPLQDWTRRSQDGS